MGEVVAMKKKVERRMVRVVNPGDNVVNNTNAELHLRDVRGALIELLRPGKVFSSDVPIEVYFDSDVALTFRSYVNAAPEGFPDDYVY